MVIVPVVVSGVKDCRYILRALLRFPVPNRQGTALPGRENAGALFLLEVNNED